jgi:hypothetical protein
MPSRDSNLSKDDRCKHSRRLSVPTESTLHCVANL